MSSSILTNVSLRFRLALFCSFLVFFPSENCCAQKATGRVTAGGIGRYKGGNWGLARGQFVNRSDEDQTVTAVVNQKFPPGNQFARSVQVPAGVERITQWPLYVEENDGSPFEFEFIVVNGEGGRETITRNTYDQMVESFLVLGSGQRLNSPGFCGHIFSRSNPEPDNIAVDRLLIELRDTANLPRMVLGLDQNRLRGYPEALHPLDQLAITSPDLSRFPDTCDAIRLWIQRGGRALLLLDQMGEDSARAILGEALPFTVVDETSPMHLRLKHHVPVSSRKTIDLSYQRTLKEPVRMIRAIFDKGTVHWSHDDWPVLVEVPVGNGFVFVSTIPAQVFSEDVPDTGPELEPLAKPILEQVFLNPTEAPLLPAEALSSIAQGQIGYSIPDRRFPAIVLSLFLFTLSVVGWFLAKKQQQTRLLVAVPICALAAMAPGLATGLAARNTAPATLIETRVIHAPPGQSTLAADGITTVYQPGAQKMDLLLKDHARLLPQADSEDSGRRRFVWTDIDTSTWPDFSQPSGITSYLESSIVRLKTPLTAKASFGQDGVTVNVSNSESLNPEDAIIATRGPDRMEARPVSNGVFQSSPDDVLAPGEFSNETLLSEAQVQRKKLYEAIFVAGDRLTPFPPEPTLLFWSNSIPGTIESSDPTVRRDSSSLLVVPLDMQAPDIDETITIPAAFLPYLSIPDEQGAISPAYGNRQREWLRRKPGGETVLQFSLPQTCLPFHFDEASLQLRIRAGSRTVILQGGTVGSFKDIKALESPAGNFTIDLPVEILNADAQNGSVILKIAVGELQVASQDQQEASAEQENYWKIDRVLLTVNGHRIQASAASNSEKSNQ